MRTAGSLVTLLSSALVLASLLTLTVRPGEALAQGDRDRSSDDTPPPPKTDPGMRRVRAVPLPGRDGPREEKTGLPHKGLRGSLVEESGFGTVRKPEADAYVTTAFPPRIVYLNGVNVSSVRGETLENVRVRIDEEGNVHITAPQYEVSQDTSFHPLLPTELPRIPKARTRPLDLPEGRWSKDSARAARRGEGAAGAETGVGKGTGRPLAPRVEVLPDEESDAGGSAKARAPATPRKDMRGETLDEGRFGKGPASESTGVSGGDAGDAEGARTLRVSDEASEARAQEEGALGAKGVPAR